MNENYQDTKMKKKPLNLKSTGIISALLVMVGILLVVVLGDNNQPEPEIVTVSTLREIIDVSELSTFTAVYNGIAKVMNEKKSEKVDYYVSYNASVDAGINFDEIDIRFDDTNKTFYITMPAVYITDVEVEMESLDFLFYNDKANTSTVTEAAYKACIEDVTVESQDESDILELAEKNAVNVLTALLNPFVEQFGQEYSIIIQ